MYFELYKYMWMYKIPELPSVHRWAAVYPAYKILLFLRFCIWLMSRASCEVWNLWMVRPWSVSFSGLLWFLSLQLGLFDTNRSQVWDLNTKNINSRLKLLGSPCALVYKKFRITCFPKVQHFVGTRPHLWLIKRPVFPSHWVAKIWDKVVYKQLKISFWCSEDEVYLCDCISSPPGRLMSWLIYCGHKFGGTVFTYFWVTGDVTSPWVWLDHYDRSLSSSGTTELQKDIMAKQEAVWKLSQKGTFYICLQ